MSKTQKPCVRLTHVNSMSCWITVVINIQFSMELTEIRSKQHEPEDDSSDNNPPVSAEEFFKSPDFYKNAQKYWSQIAPTIDGMLGGLSIVDPADIQGSSRFLCELFKLKPTPAKQHALDCGAGIGRVTKNLLIKYFESVDLVEQDAIFVNKANQYLSVEGKLHPKIGEIFNEGLQTFQPATTKYDVIWCQWVLGHLTDADLSNFFRRCILSLKPNGCLIIKENCTSHDDFTIDSVDSSVTRSLRITKQILISCGLRILKISKQNNFIPGLFPVYMLACRPIQRK